MYKPMAEKTSTYTINHARVDLRHTVHDVIYLFKKNAITHLYFYKYLRRILHSTPNVNIY